MDIDLIETIKNISLIISVATSSIALITTLTTLIVKPLRKRFIAFIKISHLKSPGHPIPIFLIE